MMQYPFFHDYLSIGEFSSYALGEEEVNEDIELDRLMAHQREKRVLCNTVTGKHNSAV